MNTYYHIEVGILMTTHIPKSEVMKQRIKEEISIFCSRLERLEGLSNHIYLNNEEIIEEDENGK